MGQFQLDLNSSHKELQQVDIEHVRHIDSHVDIQDEKQRITLEWCPLQYVNRLKYDWVKRVRLCLVVDLQGSQHHAELHVRWALFYLCRDTLKIECKQLLACLNN